MYDYYLICIDLSIQLNKNRFLTSVLEKPANDS